MRSLTVLFALCVFATVTVAEDKNPPERPRKKKAKEEAPAPEPAPTEAKPTPPKDAPKEAPKSGPNCRALNPDKSLIVELDATSIGNCLSKLQPKVKAALCPPANKGKSMPWIEEFVGRPSIDYKMDCK